MTELYNSVTAPKYACAIYDDKYYYLKPLNTIKIKAIKNKIPLDTESDCIDINNQ